MSTLENIMPRIEILGDFPMFFCAMPSEAKKEILLEEEARGLSESGKSMRLGILAFPLPQVFLSGQKSLCTLLSKRKGDR